MLLPPTLICFSRDNIEYNHFWNDLSKNYSNPWVLILLHIYIYINHVFTNDTFRQFSLPLQFSIKRIVSGAKEEEEKEDRKRWGGENRARDKWLTTLFLVALSRLFPRLQKAGAIIVETLLPAIILRDKGDKLLSTAISPRQFSLIASRML